MVSGWSKNVILLINFERFLIDNITWYIDADIDDNWVGAPLIYVVNETCNNTDYTFYNNLDDGLFNVSSFCFRRSSYDKFFKLGHKIV